jgi:hypothetical protein
VKRVPEETLVGGGWCSLTQARAAIWTASQSDPRGGVTPVPVTNTRIPGAAVLLADADDYLPKLQVDDLDALLTVIGHPN